MWEDFSGSIAILIYLLGTHFYIYDILLRRTKFLKKRIVGADSDWSKK